MNKPTLTRPRMDICARNKKKKTIDPKNFVFTAKQGKFFNEHFD